MDFQTWLAFAAASIALLIVPGPTVLLVISHAMGQGRRAAVASAAGVVLGHLVAMTAALAGVGALVLASGPRAAGLAWLGAAYFCWLGLRLMRGTGGTLVSPGLHPRLPRGAVFAQLATATALNPKSIGFFIVFVPRFVQPSAALTPQIVTMILTFVAFSGLKALVYAGLGGRMYDNPRCAGLLAWLPRVGGLVLVGIGVSTLTLHGALFYPR